MFSERILSDIRSRLDLVELVGGYLPLKKAGSSFTGRCPFHNEKTASFNVNAEKQFFYCFGCQKGGNAFTFIMQVEGLSFPAAVKKLALQTGVVIEEEFTKKKQEVSAPTNEKTLAILDWTARFFHYLLTSQKEFNFARDYLKSRKITESTIKKFQIGVAPTGWNTLLNQLKKRNYTINEMIEAGVLVEKVGSPEGAYDRFRERLMFPIRNLEGRVVGFGARLLKDEKDQPKYINSPETSFFSKRNLLYGLFENQRDIRLRKEAIFVEGYMDVVGLYEGGVPYSVATMGTALTPEQCLQLRGFSRRVVTVFDADAAGVQAWHRSVSLFLEAGMFAKDLSLPEGYDPDEFVQKYGAQEFEKRCEKAPRQVTKLLSEVASQGSMSEEERARWLNSLTPVIQASRRMPDRAGLWDSLSLVFNLSLQAIRDIAETGKQKALPQPVAQPKMASKTPSFSQIELDFLASCLQRPDLFFHLKAEEWSPAILNTTIRQWLTVIRATKSPAEFQKVLTDMVQQNGPEAIVSLASKALMTTTESATQNNSEKMFGSISERIKQRAREQQIRALAVQIKLSQRMGNDEEQFRLLAVLKELRQTGVAAQSSELVKE